MKLHSAALSLILVAAPALFAQNNAFQLIGKDGKVMGRANYTIDKLKEGVRVRSKFEYKLPAPVQSATDDPDKASGGGGFSTEAQMTAEYKVAPDGNLISGFTQNGTTQMLTSFTPSKTRDEVVVGQMQGGVSGGTRSLAMPKPDFSLAPDYDPGAIQALLSGALAHPHADHTYLLLVPGGSPRSPTTALYITIADANTASGTLDGKPVTLKHYALTWNKSKGDLWADESGTLMEVKIGPTKATYVRNKFVVTP